MDTFKMPFIVGLSSLVALSAILGFVFQTPFAFIPIGVGIWALVSIVRDKG